jgi:C4-dicarboxylate-specific signal transduction histidine kinase
MDKTVETIPQPVSDYLNAANGETKQTMRVAEWNGRVSQMAFLPLSDVSGKTLGELIVLRDLTESVREARASVRSVALICFAIGSVLAGLFYLLLSRVEADLTTRSSRLKAEIAERERTQAELRRAHHELEERVEERTAELKRINIDLNTEIVSREKTQRELQTTHAKLLEASRLAGMAQVATGVLHNVGNVLNSVNVSTTLIIERIQKSKLSGLVKSASLVQAHAHDLGVFFAEDPRGKQLPGYLAKLTECLLQEQQSIAAEVSLLAKHVEHIKEIVAMQQTYATISGADEILTPADLIEDALRINSAALSRHDVNVVRQFESVPEVIADRHKVLQILINLISNAKYAMDEQRAYEKVLRVKLQRNGNGHVRIFVSDNGTGISKENLCRIFEHGFTTRKDGHGFGLHSSALAARELGGSLLAHSDGEGRGATFILELPFNKTLKAKVCNN